MSFCEVLKELREEKGVTQKEVAQACGFTPTCICQLESGARNPTGSTIRELAKYFGCSADFLLELEDDFGTKTYSATIPASAGEETLLQYFRTLTPELQGAALETVRLLAGIPAGNGLQKKA